MKSHTLFVVLNSAGGIWCAYDTAERAHQEAEARGMYVERRTLTITRVDRRGRFVRGSEGEVRV
jgi:hypothetical protein